MLWLAGPHVLILSAYILSEVARVLAYPRLQARWRPDRDQMAEFESRLAAVAEITQAVPVPRIVPGDPDDDPIVQTAVTGRPG
jgi:predicted nucleic acid-binding protein